MSLSNAWQVMKGRFARSVDAVWPRRDLVPDFRASTVADDAKSSATPLDSMLITARVLNKLTGELPVGGNVEVHDQDGLTEKVIEQLEDRKPEYRQFYVKGWGQPDFVASRAVVSSVRVYEYSRYHRIQVWNRGALAGELLVDAQDGQAFLDAILAPVHRFEESR